MLLGHIFGFIVNGSVVSFKDPLLDTFGHVTGKTRDFLGIWFYLQFPTTTVTVKRVS